MIEGLVWPRNLLLDWSKAPVYASRWRAVSWPLSLSALYERFEAPFIVEVGCIREESDIGAGNSSELFAWAVSNYGGKFRSCNIDPAHVAICEKVISRYNGDVSVVCQDGMEFLREIEDEISFLYLDAWDIMYDVLNYVGPANKHLEAFKIAEPRLHQHAVVMIDDVYEYVTYAGKGFTTIPYMLGRGWKIAYAGHQCVLVR